MTSPINRLLDGVAWKCTFCGAPMGQCDCWEKCSCGISNPKGTVCRNPETTRCSSKVSYGKYNRRTKRWE